MSWNIGANTIIFLGLKSKIEFYHIALTTTKTCPKKITLNPVEMQLLPETGKVGSEKEISCLKVCIIFKTDMDNLDIVVYHYRNNTNVKAIEKALKLTEFEKLLSKWANVLGYREVFFTRCIVFDKTTVHETSKLQNFIKNACIVSSEKFPALPQSKN